MPSRYENKNGKKDSYYTMGFPTDKEAYDYARDNGLETSYEKSSSISEAF